MDTTRVELWDLPFCNFGMAVKLEAARQQPALAQINAADHVRRLLDQPVSSSTIDPKEILVFPEEQMLCEVCYNLDPRRVPSRTYEFQPAWAREEYRIPDDVSVAKVPIDEPATLLDPARKGCLYCPVIATALRVIHPGWETKKTFLNIYLASGLPVVVILQFGSQRFQPINDHGGIGYCFGLPVQTMISSVVVDPDKNPRVEIEIYRPVVPENQQVVRGQSA